jgi:Cu(I)/Ag(I) efflux system membrane protein CusA/SilA
MRSIQDWFLKYELQTVPGVAEVATVGGMVRQYRVVVNPEKLRALGIPLSTVTRAIRRANREVGGSVIELGEAEYMIRTRGYLGSIDDIEAVPLAVAGTTSRSCCATWPGFRSARRCAGWSPTSTAKAKSPAASW